MDAGWEGKLQKNIENGKEAGLVPYSIGCAVFTVRHLTLWMPTTGISEALKISLSPDLKLAPNALVRMRLCWKMPGRLFWMPRTTVSRGRKARMSDLVLGSTCCFTTHFSRRVYPPLYRETQSIKQGFESIKTMVRLLRDGRPPGPAFLVSQLQKNPRRWFINGGRTGVSH